MSHMDCIPLEITTYWQLNGKWAWKHFGMCQVPISRSFMTMFYSFS